MKWFSSDHHFFHKNILRYCNRPYKDLNQMHKDIVNKHNEVMSKGDTVYFLGDVGMVGKHVEKLEPFLSKMRGHKILILGNHDEGNPWNYVKAGFHSVHTSLELDNGWILVHDPAKAIIHKDRFHVVGHVHDLFLTQENCLNVGVDMWGMCPVSEDVVKEYAINMGW